MLARGVWMTLLITLDYLKALAVLSFLPTERSRELFVWPSYIQIYTVLDLLCIEGHKLGRKQEDGKEGEWR